MPEITINNKKINYTLIGKGPSVVLLHGYLETYEIWNSFANKLSNFSEVLYFDIPGHGLSEPLGEVHSMEKLADSTVKLCQQLNIYKPLLVGHSMGGYIALAIADLFKDFAGGICLFHSIPFADTDEKKKNRLNDIENLMAGKLPDLVANHIPKLFNAQNNIRFKEIINLLYQNGLKHNPEGIIPTIKGMMMRKDRSFILGERLPVFIIGGLHDFFIPVSVLEKLKSAYPDIYIEILKNSGHTGFIEEEERSTEFLKKFLSTIHPK